VAVLRREHSACVFFDGELHLCSVHRALGEGALPSTCRIFPRIALTDARGTFITLSHYCPTAASMLFRTDVPLEIVESPGAFPPADYEGLNAVGELPPLLYSRVLMDLDAYGTWERHAVDVLARAATPESALATIARDARSLAAWRPGGTSLAAAIVALDRDLVPVTQSRWAEVAPVVNRYLAAHAFANWMAYQGHGLESWVRSVTAAEHALANECFGDRECPGVPLTAQRLTAAIRSADFYLRHSTDRRTLVDEWNTKNTKTFHTTKNTKITKSTRTTGEG
jgi:hypothetical protein